MSRISMSRILTKALVQADRIVSVEHLCQQLEDNRLIASDKVKRLRNISTHISIFAFGHKLLILCMRIIFEKSSSITAYVCVRVYISVYIFPANIILQHLPAMVKITVH